MTIDEEKDLIERLDRLEAQCADMETGLRLIRLRLQHEVRERESETPEVEPAR